MIYGYIRISTDKQNQENQKFEIIEFAKRNSIHIDKWIEETISSQKALEERKLGKLIKKLKKVLAFYGYAVYNRSRCDVDSVEA